MLNNSEKWAQAYPNSISAGDIDYDRMIFLENNSNYEFSSADKAKQISKEVAEEAIYTFNSIDSVFNNIGEGVASTAKTFKYLPYIALGLGAFFLFKKGVANGWFFTAIRISKQ